MFKQIIIIKKILSNNNLNKVKIWIIRKVNKLIFI